MEQFKYLKSGNVCYHLVQHLLSSSLLSKNIKIKIYSIIILPVVVYGCETWSLTLREERRVGVFENRMPRKIFGPKMDEVPGGWREIYNVEFNDLYYSPNIIWVIKSRRMRWAGRVVRMGESTGAYRVLVRKPERRDHLKAGRIILRWIFRKWDGGIDWIDLAQNRNRWRTLVNAIMNLRVPKNAGNFLTS